MMRSHLKFQYGFTLVEMIIVIVITGIIGGIVAIFLRSPVQGYVDSARRAEMTDIADTALRRLARDLRTAVPNSIRTPSPLGSAYIEFLPTSDGGRYRVDPTSGSGGCSGYAGNTLGDALNFDAADTCFEIVGKTIDFFSNDAIVIGSTQSDGSLPYKSAATGGVMRTIAVPGYGLSAVKFQSSYAFPASSELDGHRFEVVPGTEQAVTYSCLTPGVDSNGDGTGTLTRYWHYGIIASPSASPGGSSAILADKVESCNFVYDTSNQRNSLVAVTLKITRGGDSVTLYHEIHVNNIP